VAYGWAVVSAISVSPQFLSSDVRFDAGTADLLRAPMNRCRMPFVVASKPLEF
jgi:hypothetical protein